MKFNKTSKYSKTRKSITRTKKIRDSVCSYSKLNSRLYTNSVVFQFYSKSKDNEIPGTSSGEKIKQSCIPKYSELSAIPNWRKMLSNFWEPPGNEDKTKALFSL